MKSFGQTSTHPAARGFPSRSFDCAEATPDHLAFVCLRIECPLDKAMAEDLPPCCQAGIDNLRIGVADGRIETHRSANIVTVQYLFQTPEADTQAIIKPAKISNIGQYGDTLGRWQYRTGHGSIDVPLLHIDDWPDANAGIARQF